MTALRFAVAPMLRSKAPVARGTTTASASSAATDWAEAIECTVPEVRKRFGSQIPKMRMNKAHRYSPLKRSKPKLSRLPLTLTCPPTFPGRGSPWLRKPLVEEALWSRECRGGCYCPAGTPG